MGQSPDSSSYNNNCIGLPLVQGNADMCERIATPQRYTSQPTKICEAGSIILSVRAPVGTVGKTFKKICLGRGVCGITSKNIEFMYQYLLNNENSWRHIEQGGTFTAINSDDIKSFPIILPSLPEQQKIADFLSLVDQRIKKQRQLVESLKKYKRGLFSYYFQKNKSYKIARLGDFAKIYQPSTISQSQFNDGKYKVFGANGYIGNYDKYNHAVPQVTISCRGEKCGTVNFVDAYTWITGNSMVVNIDDQNEINKRYLYHCLSNQNLKYLVSGSAQPQIIRTDVARHSIPVPSIEFQEKLSFFLDSIEQKIKNEQTMEECLFDMKNALLQQMFI